MKRSLSVDEISSFPSGGFSNQDVSSIKAGGMKLHKLHILKGHPCLIG
jgi:hypothetical protein